MYFQFIINYKINKFQLRIIIWECNKYYFYVAAVHEVFYFFFLCFYYSSCISWAQHFAISKSTYRYLITIVCQFDQNYVAFAIKCEREKKLLILISYFFFQFVHIWIKHFFYNIYYIFIYNIYQWQFYKVGFFLGKRIHWQSKHGWQATQTVWCILNWYLMCFITIQYTVVCAKQHEMRKQIFPMDKIQTYCRNI